MQQGGDDDQARLLYLLLLLGIVILDARRFIALGVGQDARHGAAVLDHSATFARFLEIGDLRIGQSPGWAAGIAPAVIDAGRPSLEGIH